MIHIGCHLSSSNGCLWMGQEAVRIGADTFAFYKESDDGYAEEIKLIRGMEYG